MHVKGMECFFVYVPWGLLAWGVEMRGLPCAELCLGQEGGLSMFWSHEKWIGLRRG